MSQLHKDISEYLRFLLSRSAGAVYADEPAELTTKKAQLDALKEKYTACTQCPLATQGRTQVVFGVGDPDATVMFVGEGPGRDEDLQGAPFVGRSGKLLTKIIEAMGLSRETVYISNTVKCRPPSNRAPLPKESTTCIDRLLLQEIAIIKPKIICTLGASAMRALLGDQATLKEVRGKFIQVDDFEVIATYHPAYLLRNPSAKADVWADMQKIMAKI
ncbi:MAG: uracil-DNA glycosylase [Candidatus Dependentiae bacterium]|jgi:DNA polymerase